MRLGARLGWFVLTSFLVVCVLYNAITPGDFNRFEEVPSSKSNAEKHNAFAVGLSSGTIVQGDRGLQAATEQRKTVTGSKKLVLAAHARGGSTFIGNMFKRHRNSMYWVEPDSYRDLYLGAELIMPNEVTHFQNGNRRQMPEWEQRMHVMATSGMLNCDFSQVPLNVLIFPVGVGTHCDKFKKFWKQLDVDKNWNQYLACLRIVKKKFPNCDWKQYWLHPDHICVNSRYTQLYNMWKQQFQPAGFNHDRYYNTSQEVMRCLLPVENKINAALPALRNSCRNASLNVVKYVRIRLAELLRIIDSENNFQGILLTRDPRSVAASRKKTWPGWPFRENLIRHTISLCEDVLDDHLLWQRVKDKYHRRILYVSYENITQQPEEWARRLYRHAGLEADESLMQWVRSQMHCQTGGNRMNTCRNVKDVHKFNAKWKLTITEAEATAIDSAKPCLEVYKLLGLKSWKETVKPDSRAQFIPKL